MILYTRIVDLRGGLEVSILYRGIYFYNCFVKFLVKVHVPCHRWRKNKPNIVLGSCTFSHAKTDNNYSLYYSTLVKTWLNMCTEFCLHWRCFILQKEGHILLLKRIRCSHHFFQKKIYVLELGSKTVIKMPPLFTFKVTGHFINFQTFVRISFGLSVNI